MSLNNAKFAQARCYLRCAEYRGGNKTLVLYLNTGISIEEALDLWLSDVTDREGLYGIDFCYWLD